MTNQSQNSEFAISVKGLSKTYASGFQALKNINLEIKRGEIFALLGPNGAGKTTLINIISGIVNPTSGVVLADGFDIIKDYRITRDKIGLVPQELTTDFHASVISVVEFSQGLYGKPRNMKAIENILQSLSLWDRRDSTIRTLSGGMKRRVMIAKALSHEPMILFLDEPTAGVDVNLRRDMWNLVRKLREGGVTVILTTHYIEEAQEMADRIGVINKGEIIVVEEKHTLMQKLGKKKLTVNLVEKEENVPAELIGENIELSSDGMQLIFTFDATANHAGIPDLMKKLAKANIEYKDLNTKESSLEEIFVDLVKEKS